MATFHIFVVLKIFLFIFYLRFCVFSCHLWFGLVVSTDAQQKDQQSNTKDIPLELGMLGE